MFDKDKDLHTDIRVVHELRDVVLDVKDFVIGYNSLSDVIKDARAVGADQVTIEDNGWMSFVFTFKKGSEILQHTYLASGGESPKVIMKYKSP